MKKRDLEQSLKSLGWWFLREKAATTKSGPMVRKLSLFQGIVKLRNPLLRRLLKKPKHSRETGDNYMRFEGRTWKDKGSKYWLIEVPLLDVTTQGTSKEDAYRMIADAIEALIHQKGFKIDARSAGGGNFTIGASDENALIALMLKRQREAHHLTLVELANRLGQKSPNAYARYEQGKSVPTVEKLKELMKAIDPGFEPVLKIA
jgi:predicted RNase H-like HicB family nuclease